jgi:hypothetical protein
MERISSRVAGSAATALLFALAVAAPVLAEEARAWCRAGAACTLTGTYVNGNIEVRAGATLSASDADVVGNIDADGARAVYIAAGSWVGGNVQVDDTDALTISASRVRGQVQAVNGGRVKVVDSRIGGDLDVVQNDGAVEIRRTYIGDDVQAIANTGGVAIFANRIDGNLQCRDNRPRPTGDDNVVGGQADGQCSGF